MTTTNPKNKIFVYSKTNQTPKLQQLFNEGYILRQVIEHGLRGLTHLFILELYEPTTYGEQKEIAEFKIVQLKNKKDEINPDSQTEINKLKQEGFRIKAVTTTTPILVKYHEANDNVGKETQT